MYGIRATLPAVGGNDGVGVVTKVGKDVNTVEEGDWVVPVSAGLGSFNKV